MATRAFASLTLGLAAAGLAATPSGLLPATLAATQDQAVFRTAVEGVSVNVSVRRGGQPITGLDAGDFELLDNGVKQSIVGLSFETLPIDVTLLLDASRSVEGPRLARLKESVVETAGLLTPADRLRLIAVQHALRRIFPFQPGGASPDVTTLNADGGTSLFDGLSAAMMRRTEQERRHLVIGYTDGRDTISSVAYDDVLAIASRTDAVVHLVVPNAPPSRATSGDRSILPRLGPLATTTGGQVFMVDVGAPIAEAFTRSIEDFRRSYVLRYTPSGVPAAGWHEITVRVPGHDDYEVRARRGWGGQ